MSIEKYLERIAQREQLIQSIKALPDNAEIIALAKVDDDSEDTEVYKFYQIGGITKERSFWIASVFQDYLKGVI